MLIKQKILGWLQNTQRLAHLNDDEKEKCVEILRIPVAQPSVFQREALFNDQYPWAIEEAVEGLLHLFGQIPPPPASSHLCASVLNYD